MAKRKNSQTRGLPAPKLNLKNRKDNPLDVLKTGPISAWPYPKVVGAVLMERAMSHADDVFYDFWSIAMQGLPLMKMPYGRTDVVRNKLAIELLKTDFTHLLMLDIDHQHPWDIVQRLSRWVLLDPKKLVIGGLNFRRGPPYDPCCYLRGQDGQLYPPAEWSPGLICVDAIGTGSILIAREVFEQIPPPWFYNDYSRVFEDIWPGEDLGFSQACNAAGIDLWVDTTTTSPHMIDAVIDENSYRAYLEDHQDVEKLTVAEFREQLGGGK